MSKVTLTYWIIIALAAPCLWATTGQEPHPPTALEIPFLDRDAMGARWIAMGGASIAAIDDGSSLAINPAGLAKIRRIELLGTIQKQSADIEATWFGSKVSRSATGTTLREVSVSFPLPTYRGSLVLGGSVIRRNVLDAYTLRAGTNPDGDVPYEDRERRDGMLTAWSGGVAMQVSPQAFVGLEAHAFSGDFDETDDWAVWGDCSDVVFAWNTDLGGYGASVGMQYQPSTLVGIGAVLRTPQRITLEGEIEQPEWDAYKSECVSGRYSVDDTATLPYSVGLGLVLTPANVLASLDIVYTDWQELDYPGYTRDPDTDEYIYGATTDIRVGAEYAVSAFPLRLRAGYARVPLELNWFEVTKDRTSLSLGAGTVVESALGFDVAWQHTSYERESTADQYSEKRTNDRLLVTLAYRF
jgi:hypothetical protein